MLCTKSFNISCKFACRELYFIVNISFQINKIRYIQKVEERKSYRRDKKKSNVAILKKLRTNTPKKFYHENISVPAQISNVIIV